MHYSKIGSTACQQWLQIPSHYTDVAIDQFVIMPNHVHGIIRIITHPIGTADPIVGTAHVLSLQDKRHRTKMQLSKIIHGYKGAVSRIAHTSDDKTFSWQRSFHDHIIRNDQELFRIRQYIKNNPKNW